MSQKASNQEHASRGRPHAANASPVHSLAPQWGSDRDVAPGTRSIPLGIVARDAQGGPVAGAEIDYVLSETGGNGSNLVGEATQPTKEETLVTDAEGYCGGGLWVRFGLESGEVAVVARPRYPANDSAKAEIHYRIGTKVATTLRKEGGNEGATYPTGSTQLVVMAVTLLDQNDDPMRGETIVFEISPADDTGTHFKSGEEAVSVRVDDSGKAILAAEILVGPRAGSLLLRASFHQHAPPPFVFNEYTVEATRK